LPICFGDLRALTNAFRKRQLVGHSFPKM
jgi:hypothetical protein